MEEEPLKIYDEMTIHYNYSYGGISKFFHELKENARLLGAKCKKCNTVWCPPRANCPKCYSDIEWITLPGTGTIYTFTVVYYPSSGWTGDKPYVCAYIKLDGADNAIMHWIKDVDITTIKIGTRVKVKFKEVREGKVSDFYFVLK